MAARRRKPRPPREPRRGWFTQSTLGRAVTRGDGSGLVVAVLGEGDRWVAVALEGPAQPGGLEAIFASHAHAVVAENVTLPEAMTACDDYITLWLGGADAAPCDCEPITLPEPRRAPRSAKRPAGLRGGTH